MDEDTLEYFAMGEPGYESVRRHISAIAIERSVGIQAVYMQESEPTVIFNLRLGLCDQSLSVSLEP